MSKWILIYIVLSFKFSYSQCEIDFEIKDTINCEKFYFAVYTDTNMINNTLTRTITIFIKNKKEFNVINIDSLKSYSLYTPSQNLVFQIISSTKYSHLLKGHNKIYSELKIKKIKHKGLFTLYSVDSPNGFIHWEISPEKYNLARSINMLSYPNIEKCISIYSPLNW